MRRLCTTLREGGGGAQAAQPSGRRSRLRQLGREQPRRHRARRHTGPDSVPADHANVANASIPGARASLQGQLRAEQKETGLQQVFLDLLGGTGGSDALGHARIMGPSHSTQPPTHYATSRAEAPATSLQGGWRPASWPGSSWLARNLAVDDPSNLADLLAPATTCWGSRRSRGTMPTKCDEEAARCAPPSASSARPSG